MLRAMHRRTDAMDALEPLRSRFNAQHYNLYVDIEAVL